MEIAVIHVLDLGPVFAERDVKLASTLLVGEGAQDGDFGNGAVVVNVFRVGDVEDVEGGVLVIWGRKQNEKENEGKSG